MIALQIQPDGYSCVSTCLAMTVGIPVEVIIEAGITQGDKIVVDIDENNEKIITQIVTNPTTDSKLLS